MNRTQIIYDELIKRLEKGEYPPQSKFPSEAALAEEFNVSKLTINKIVGMISGTGRLIRGKSGAGTWVAKSFFHSKGNLFYLGPLVPYSSAVISGFQSECLLRGYFPVIFTPKSGEIARCLQMLNSPGAVGAVSMQLGLLPPCEELNMFFLDYPMGHTAERPHLHYISSDDYNGAREMMQEILKRGHKEIVIFSGQRFFISPEAPVPPRVRGFQSVLAEAGMRDAPERTFYCSGISQSETQIVLKKILARYPDTTVICTDSDNSAELLHHAAENMGLALPGDIALTGFGNVSTLKIPSVDQHPGLQGQLAAKHLIDFHEGILSDDPMIDESVPASVTDIEHLPIRLS